MSKRMDGFTPEQQTALAKADYPIFDTSQHFRQELSDIVFRPFVDSHNDPLLEDRLEHLDFYLEQIKEGIKSYYYLRETFQKMNALTEDNHTKPEENTHGE